MAPEQLDGHEITTAADVFAWGAFVCYAATGRRLLGGGDPCRRPSARDLVQLLLREGLTGAPVVLPLPRS